MILLKQTKLHNKEKKIMENCLITSYACYLDKKIAECPAIEEKFGTDDWQEELDNWLDDLGYEEIYYHIDPYKSKATKDYYFVWGKSPRDEDIHHQVIFERGVLFHDPHPDNKGLKEVNGYIVLEKID